MNTTSTGPASQTGPADDLGAAASALAACLDAARFELSVDGVDLARSRQREVSEQLSTYVVPRLAAIEAPLVVVVGGPTGAGKSTLVNSIVGKQVSDSGVLRPTTRTPVLVHHPADTEWFASDRVLSGFARTGSSSDRPRALRQIATSNIQPGLAIVDAPDFDSIDEANREIAEELLSAADLWLFVTSAARYADQVPWDHLERAAQRQASVAVVLDRTAESAVREVRRHLARMLTERNLSDVALFTVPESEPDEHGVLPGRDVAQIVMWLRSLAADAQARRTIVLATVRGALAHDVQASRALLAELDAQSLAAESLRRDVETVYRQALDEIVDRVTDGSMLRGEVLARWQEFVGTGEIFRHVEERVGRWRDRLFSRRGRTKPADVEEAVGSGLHLLILDRAERAAEATARAWEADQPGRRLIADHPGLDRASRAVRARSERIAREWQESVFALVSAEGEHKRSRAKVLSFGVNSVGVALMVVVFAGTAGLTGAEVGIAGGTALAGQKLLEAIFGDQAVRDLSAKAAADLRDRIGSLFDDEAARFLDLVPDPADLSASRTELEQAIAGVDTAMAGRFDG